MKATMAPTPLQETPHHSTSPQFPTPTGGSSYAFGRALVWGGSACFVTFSQLSFWDSWASISQRIPNSWRFPLFLLGVSLSIFVFRSLSKRSLEGWDWSLLGNLLSLFGLQLAARQGWFSPFISATLALHASLCAGICLLRCVRLSGISQGFTTPPPAHSLLLAALSLALPTALLPYFGALPVHVGLLLVCGVWWWAEQHANWNQLRAFFLGFGVTLSWGLLATTPGWFLVTPSHVPIDERILSRSSFFLERRPRLGGLRVRGPGFLSYASEAHRWAESFVHPALAGLPTPTHVLLLQGADGYALRELLRLPHIRHVSLWTSHTSIFKLFAHHPLLRSLHQDSFRDPRVRLRFFSSTNQLLQALQHHSTSYDLILQQFPWPNEPQDPLPPTYAHLLQKHLHPHGRIGLFWGDLPSLMPLACLQKRWQKQRWKTRIYRAYGLDIRWGFLLLSKRSLPVFSQLPLPHGLRYLTPSQLRKGATWSPQALQTLRSPQCKPNTPAF